MKISIKFCLLCLFTFLASTLSAQYNVAMDIEVGEYIGGGMHNATVTIQTSKKITSITIQGDSNTGGTCRGLNNGINYCRKTVAVTCGTEVKCYTKDGTAVRSDGCVIVVEPCY